MANWKNIFDEKLFEKNWTKRYFSKKINVSPQTVNNWINRNSIPKNKLFEVSSLLGLNVQYLLRPQQIKNNDLVDQVYFPMVAGAEMLPNFLETGKCLEQVSFSAKFLKSLFNVKDLSDLFVIYGLSFSKPMSIGRNSLVFLEKLKDVSELQKGIYLKLDGDFVVVKNNMPNHHEFCARLFYVWEGGPLEV